MDNNNNKWDVLGLASIGITIFGASIFYVAGWAYLSHWYGYFGLALNTLSLPTHICMAHGFFGIFATLFLLLILMFLVSFVGTVILHKSLYQSVGLTIVLAPLVSGVLILVIIGWLNRIDPTGIPITNDVFILFPLFVVCSLFSLVVYSCALRQASPGERDLPTWLQIIFVAVFFILSSVSISATLGEYEARNGVSLFPEIREPLSVTVAADSALSGLKDVAILEEAKCIYHYKGLVLLAATEDSYYLLEGDRKAEFTVHGVPKTRVCQLIIGQ